MAAEFRNIAAIDFVTDPTGQTGKASVSFYSVFDNPTENGAILTPWENFTTAITNIVSGRTLNCGDWELPSSTYDISSKVLTIRADTIGLSVARVGPGSTTFVAGGQANNVKFEIIGVWFRDLNKIYPDSHGRRFDVFDCVFELNQTLYIGNTPSNPWTFRRNLFVGNASFGHGSSRFESKTLEHNFIAGLFWNYFPTVTTNELCTGTFRFNILNDFKISLTGGSTVQYTVMSEIPISIMGKNIINGSVTFYDSINGDIVYADLAAAKAAHPTYFTQCDSGDIKLLGDITRGEFLLDRDSFVYSFMPEFSGHPSMRPGKASWLVNSGSAGWVHTNTAFSSDRLTATAASGYADITVALQVTGLKNPTVWLGAGLYYATQTPTVGTSPTTANPQKLTFEADYKVVGGGYTGSYHKFVWNEPMGYDDTGAYSGDDSYNPLTRVAIQIEEIKFRIHVQQGANTAGTGIYGFYVAPTSENVCVKIVDQFGVGISGVDVQIIAGAETKILPTDSNGFTDISLFSDLTGETTVSVSDLRYFQVTEVFNQNHLYNYYQLSTRKAAWYRVRAVMDGLYSPWAGPVQVTE